MRKFSKTATLALVIGSMLFSLASTTSAFDGKRSGFILGLGLGYGNTSTSHMYADWGMSDISISNSGGGFITDFKIGGGSEQLLIYYSSKAAFNQFGDTLALQGLGGIGVSCYLHKYSPSVYFTGTVGLTSLVTAASSGDGEAQLGTGWAIGAGYEFARHYSIEANIIKGSLGENSYGATGSVSAFRITLNALAF